jgi:hypothetical protein
MVASITGVQSPLNCGRKLREKSMGLLRVENVYFGIWDGGIYEQCQSEKQISLNCLLVFKKINCLSLNYQCTNIYATHIIYVQNVY